MRTFKNFAGVVTLVLAMVLGMGGVADATGRTAAGPSICQTGGRESAEYRRLCMRLGSPQDGITMWRSIPLGMRGKERDGDFTRYALCKFAAQHGGIRASVKDTLYDMAFDQFIYHNDVLAVAGFMAKVDCLNARYKV